MDKQTLKCHRKKSRGRKKKVTAKRQKIERVLCLPFLKDKKSIRYIKNSKIIFIMRGLPGSGKTTTACMIKDVYKYAAIVCSSDNYLTTDDKTYNWTPEKLTEGHRYCQEVAKKLCEYGMPVLIIDNTNLQYWNIKPYTALALQYDYVVVIVEPQTTWKFDAVECQKKCRHNLSLESIKDKQKCFENFIPIFYAWFLNVKDSENLKAVGEKYFKECLKKVPELVGVLKNFKSEENENCENHFSLPKKLLHCTAKFCARGGAPDSEKFLNLELVKISLGCAFKLKITGILITPKTLSARVELNSNELKIMDKSEYENLQSKHAEKSLELYEMFVFDDDDDKEKLDDIALEFVKKIGAVPFSEVKDAVERLLRNAKENDFVDTSAGQAACQTDEESDSSDEELESKEKSQVCEGKYNKYKVLEGSDDYPGKGKAVHITLGCAEGIKPNETNYDVLKVLKLESSQSGTEISIDNATIVYYEEGICMVYFKTPMCIPALYSGQY